MLYNINNNVEWVGIIENWMERKGLELSGIWTYKEIQQKKPLVDRNLVEYCWKIMWE